MPSERSSIVPGARFQRRKRVQPREVVGRPDGRRGATRGGKGRVRKEEIAGAKYIPGIDHIDQSDRRDATAID